MCEKSRGREDPHKAKGSDEQALVTALMDDCSVSEMKDKVMRIISDTGNTKIVLKD